MFQKLGKVHNFLPQDHLAFLNLGKIGNLVTPPPGPNFGKIEIPA